MTGEADDSPVAGGESKAAPQPKAVSTSRGLPLSRRKLLIGAAVGGGLLAGWTLWPDDDIADLPAAENERAFGLWLKIATSGQVTLNVAQSEMGQGVMTMLAEAAAHELGADWRTMAIQPVTGAHAFANMLLAKEWGQARVGGLLGGDGWARGFPSRRRRHQIRPRGPRDYSSFDQSFRSKCAFHRLRLEYRGCTQEKQCQAAKAFLSV